VLALYQAGVIMTFIMIGHDSRIIARWSGQPYAMFESGVCMFTIVILVVHIEAMQVCVCVCVHVFRCLHVFVHARAHAGARQHAQTQGIACSLTSSSMKRQC